MTWDELFEVDYGTPLSELGVVVQRVLRQSYHKIAPQKYIFACADDLRDETLRICGFVWVASDGAARRVLTGELSADDFVNIAPPDELLPSPGLWQHKLIVAHASSLAPNSFYDVALKHRMVRLKKFTYFYRDENPANDAFPCAISVDLRPGE